MALEALFPVNPQARMPLFHGYIGPKNSLPSWAQASQHTCLLPPLS